MPPKRPRWKPPLPAAVLLGVQFFLISLSLLGPFPLMPFLPSSDLRQTVLLRAILPF